ncbi:MAG: AMP-binding protein [Cyclobacteriaceae bacterium]
MGGIIIENDFFDFDLIKTGKCENADPGFTSAFDFCKAWLLGEDHFLLQTSGSTRLPKNIPVTRKQMMCSAEATRAFFQLDEGCTLLCCLDTERIAGKMMLVRAMEWKARLVLVPPSANPLLGMEKWNFDFVAMVPLQVQACLTNEFSREILDWIGVLVIGGAPSSEVLIKQVRMLKGSVYQTYGMTETVSHIALGNLKEPGPLVYEVLPGVTIGLGSEGTLRIKAPMTSDSWITTRDVVEMFGKNKFAWKGRADFVINSGGIKLHPEEIEKEIRPIVEQFFPQRAFFISGKPDEQLGQALLLVLEGERDTTKKNRLLDLAKNQLPKYHVPKSIVFLPKFEMTRTGKINQIETLKKCL